MPMRRGALSGGVSHGESQSIQSEEVPAVSACSSAAFSSALINGTAAAAAWVRLPLALGAASAAGMAGIAMASGCGCCFFPPLAFFTVSSLTRRAPSFATLQQHWPYEMNHTGSEPLCLPNMPIRLTNKEWDRCNDQVRDRGCAAHAMDAASSAATLSPDSSFTVASTGA